MNGTCSTPASLPSGYNPDAYAAMVLSTGKAVIIGGEYNNGSFALTNLGAVYDPLAYPDHPRAASFYGFAERHSAGQRDRPLQ